jgi:hypothetical protein
MNWSASLRHLLDAPGASCAIIGNYDESSGIANTWPIYGDNGRVVFRNILIPLDILQNKIGNLYMAPPYNDDECSEWYVNISDIRDFLDKASP